MTSQDIKDKGEINHGVNSPPALPAAQGDAEMWETRGPNHTLLELFLYQHLDINKNIKKKSHRRLHIEKEGKRQGEIHQINRLPESFQSEVIGFLLSQQGLIFLASGMLQLWGKPLCKAGKSPAGSPNLANQGPCSNKTSGPL